MVTPLHTILMNDGIILGQRDSDYVGNTLPYETLNLSGDWTPWLPLEEWQTFPPLETMACVTFSGLNVIETLYFFLTGIRRNFSDRYTARMSGTTQNGNWLWKVADSIRKDGIVDEEVWPVPANVTWDSYYTDPPMAVINKAKDFLKEWEIQYEFIDFTKESLLHHIKQSPIQVVIPGHAVMNFLTTDQIYKYFDSYPPFIKERTDDFISALKYVLREKQKGMTHDEVEKIYVLAFYRLPDSQEVAFWTGKPLADFLAVAIKDRANFLTQHE